MPEIIVLGGGLSGLATAILLARDGHDVTVLERDAEPPPATLEEAIEDWPRRGVAQFRQAHYMLARGRTVLDEHLPDVRDALLAAGACAFDMLGIMPPDIADRSPRPGDERFPTVTARRPVLEWVFARAAVEEPGVEIRRGVEAEALVARANGVPHVTGVRTAAGETLAADLVVDAMGRRSKLPALLADVGAGPVHEEAEDSGFCYYTRFFRSADGRLPQYRAAPITPFESFSLLTLPGDNGTWSVTIYVPAGDRALKAVRNPEPWSALVRACGAHAHWLDGEPISDVLPMAGVLDRYRRLAIDGRPFVTGLALVADAAVCTNPSLARGIALGLGHAARLRDVVRAHLDDPRELAEAWDAVTEAEFTPWYRATVATDRARLAEIELARSGGSAAPPADPAAALRARFPLAATRDPDVFRAFLEVVGCLTLPADVLARPGLADRVLELTSDAADLPKPPGPSRDELVRLLA
jgi:2-polyprenyl-6-methoxyphenol hydroxylase-like FAD-dependent oxidoreductase